LPRLRRAFIDRHGRRAGRAVGGRFGVLAFARFDGEVFLYGRGAGGFHDLGDLGGLSGLRGFRGFRGLSGLSGLRRLDRLDGFVRLLDARCLSDALGAAGAYAVGVAIAVAVDGGFCGHGRLREGASGRFEAAFERCSIAARAARRSGRRHDGFPSKARV